MPTGASFNEQRDQSLSPALWEHLPYCRGRQNQLPAGFAGRMAESADFDSAPNTTCMSADCSQFFPSRGVGLARVLHGLVVDVPLFGALRDDASNAASTVFHCKPHSSCSRCLRRGCVLVHVLHGLVVDTSNIRSLRCHQGRRSTVSRACRSFDSHAFWRRSETAAALFCPSIRSLHCT